MKYTIIARRTTCYEVDAMTRDEAIEKMMDGTAKEVDGNTEDITASAECPDCGDVLTNRTTYEHPDGTWEPSYCDSCDREVAWA